MTDFNPNLTEREQVLFVDLYGRLTALMHGLRVAMKAPGEHGIPSSRETIHLGVQAISATASTLVLIMSVTDEGKPPSDETSHLLIEMASDMDRLVAAFIKQNQMDLENYNEMARTLKDLPDDISSLIDDDD